MAEQVWAVQLKRWNPHTEAEDTFSYATSTRFTVSGSPASDTFTVRLIQPAWASRTAFDDHTTQGRGRIAVGQVVLKNLFGDLDQYANYPVDGRSITIYLGEEGNDFPGDFDVVLDATMEAELIGQDASTIKLRDWQRAANIPLQTAFYAGDNVAPDGLEGAEDLKGKPKPVCFGSPFNVSPVCVNAVKQIYQVHDGALDAITDVRDMGISLTSGATDWTSATSNFSSDAVRAAADNGSVSIIVGDGGKISTSTDGGQTWTARTSGVATALYAVVWFEAASLWIAGGANGVILTASSSGASWTSRTSGFSTTTIRSIACSDTIAVAVGDSGKASTSSNGTSWSAQSTILDTTSSAQHLYAIAYRLTAQGPAWVAGGAVSTLYYSTTGTTGSWTALASRSAGIEAFRSIAAGESSFVAVGDLGMVYRTDGIGDVWSKVSGSGLTVFGTANVSGVAFARGLFAAVDDENRISVSRDNGRTFEERRNATTGDATCVSPTSSGWIVGGTSGSIEYAAGVGSYASAADLEDDSLAPPLGTYKLFLDANGSYFRLGSPPIGKVTCDPVQDATLTAADGWALCYDRAGYVSGTDYSASDITTANATNSAPTGYYTTEGDRVMCAEVAGLFAQSIGAADFTDKDGVQRFQILESPAENVVSNGSALATGWTASGTASATNAVATYQGRSFSRVTNANSGDIDQSVTLTGDGTKDLYFLIRTDGAAGEHFTTLIDDTAGSAARLQVRSVIASDGTITSAATFGSLRATARLGDNVYAIAARSTTCTAANAHRLLANQQGAGSASSLLLSSFEMYDTPPDVTLVSQDGTSGEIVDLQPASSADRDSGLPITQAIVRYKTNYTPLSGTELAGGVSDTDRVLYGKAWLASSTSEDADVVAAHPLAKSRTFDTLLVAETDADAEAARLAGLFGVERSWCDATVLATSTTAAVELLNVAELRTSRFLMGAGTRFRVLGVRPDAHAGRVLFQLWR